MSPTAGPSGLRGAEGGISSLPGCEDSVDHLAESAVASHGHDERVALEGALQGEPASVAALGGQANDNLAQGPLS